MRTIVDLPTSQLEALDSLCRREGISRAEAVRRAVGEHLERHRSDRHGAFGLWRTRAVDSLEYERALRDEWDPAGRG
jgi:metal-responsive CopG/Arc/MetJ family transcriptional regulator